VERFATELPGEPAALRELRQQLDGWLTSQAVEGEDRDLAIIAAHHAAVYTLQRGAPTIDLAATRDSGRVTIEVTAQLTTEPRGDDLVELLGLLQRISDQFEIAFHGSGSTTTITITGRTGRSNTSSTSSAD